MHPLYDLELLGTLLLVLDIGLVAFVASVVARSLSPIEANGRVRFLVGCLATCVIVFGSALLLSTVGLLSRWGFLGIHALVAVIALPFQAQVRSAPSPSTASPSPDGHRWLTGAAIWILAVAAVVIFAQAFLAEPLNYDSNTYRLTRIGYWLQEGKVSHFPTNDPRHNYIPFLPDVLMLWLTSHYATGYPMVNLVQWFFGVVLAAATWELGRAIGFRPLTCAAVTAFMVGMPNVALQLFTSHTDVTATALAFTGVVLLRMACHARESRAWLWCGAAFGLSIAAKGVIFYWAPGLAVLLIAWLRIERYPLVEGIRQIALCTAVCLVVGSPPYLSNLTTYGNPFAPPAHAASIHAKPNTARAEFAAKNLTTYAWQLLEPNSNPLIPSALLVPCFESVADEIENWERPPTDRFRAAIKLARWSYSIPAPDEDFATFGVLPMALGCSALLLIAMAPGLAGKTARMDLIWLAVSAVIFLVCLASLQAWTPHKYRYFVLMAPILSLLGGALIETSTSARRRWFAPVASLVFVAGIASLAAMSVASYHHGWRTLRIPNRSPHRNITASMRDLIGHLPPIPLRIGLALREDTWIASFLRARTGVKFRFLPFEDVIASGLRETMEANNLDAVILNTTTEVPIPVSLPRFDNAGFAIVAPPGSLLLPETISPDSGIFSDGWSAEVFTLRLSNVSKRRILGFTAVNSTPLDRTLSVTLDGTLFESRDILADTPVYLGVPIEPGSHLLEFNVTPAFVPADHTGGADTRRLGLRFPKFEGAPRARPSP